VEEVQMAKKHMKKCSPSLAIKKSNQNYMKFPTKSQILEIHKHEKHFKVSHNKEFHKVEVLARIYFSITE
jgi:hypothetical protein